MGIIKTRPFARGGLTYEISHNRLVPPIEALRDFDLAAEFEVRQQHIRTQEEVRREMAKDLHVLQRKNRLQRITIALLLTVLSLALIWKSLQ